MVSPPAAPDDIPPTPTRRGAAAALLAGSAALMALLLVLDLYGMLPAELLAPVAPFGPPAQVTVVIAVLVEGLVAAFLVSSGRHPLDAPFINHYGTRTAAAGGVLLTAGIVAFLVWETALRFFWGTRRW